MNALLGCAIRADPGLRRTGHASRLPYADDGEGRSPIMKAAPGDRLTHILTADQMHHPNDR